MAVKKTQSKPAEKKVDEKALCALALGHCGKAKSEMQHFTVAEISQLAKIAEATPPPSAAFKKSATKFWEDYRERLEKGKATSEGTDSTL